MLIVVAFLLTSFIVAAGLVLLRLDAGWGEAFDRAFGDDDCHR